MIFVLSSVIFTEEYVLSIYNGNNYSMRFALVIFVCCLITYVPRCLRFSNFFFIWFSKCIVLYGVRPFSVLCRLSVGLSLSDCCPKRNNKLNLKDLNVFIVKSCYTI